MTVLRRLDRIAAFEREGASAAVVLAELRALLEEADRYAEEEGGEPCVVAVERLRQALVRDMIAV